MTALDHQPRSYPFRQPRRLDVDPECAWLRREQPVCRVELPYGGEGWLVTRHADARTVLADPRFSRAALVGRDVPRTAPRIPHEPTILTMDPPDHSRLRRLVSRAFSSRRINEIEPRVRQLTQGLLDRVHDHGPPADLVAHLAQPLPSAVICELLGVPEADRPRFFSWADAVLTSDADSPARIATALTELKGYLAELVAQRREEPTDDVLGALVLARDERGQLSEHELVTFGVTLLLAGLETTANQIGNFVYHLLTHPDQLATLTAGPHRLADVVEELLRLIPISAHAGFTRVATEDVELNGVLVRAGEAVLVDLDSANRDEAVFTDPDRVDLGRERNPHLAFGHGAHHCLGAQLARMELRTAIGELLTRFPGLALAVPASDLLWKHASVVRGLRELPVTWSTP
ncbi:cytochrome P450 [Goodfellowiella coeruleoviolacea]|uniref:Cytochrome P450 n=1 Tax=Goodfellowiella coeruleoviolacea TaxID=334858 RepID=A0AAE3GHD1_9PSEU|nr:cytochrome P450 [Goodfellowiella coeruleoviolacea]MCP2167394.1 Cytochrome P450 [Goodfellowiella coeruleoviolacea]